MKTMMNGVGRSLTTLGALLLRIVLGVAGLMFMVGVMLFGLAVFGVLLIWALLRGRRPAPLRFNLGPGPGWQRFHTGPAGRRPSPPAAEVVDIEVREIADSDPRRD